MDYLSPSDFVFFSLHPSLFMPPPIPHIPNEKWRASWDLLKIRKSIGAKTTHDASEVGEHGSWSRLDSQAN